MSGHSQISGRMLRELRERAGLGLRAVARARHLSDSHLSRVERGEREVTPSVVAAYSSALRRPVDATLISELLGGSDDAERRAFGVEVRTIAAGGASEHGTALLAEEAAFLAPPARVGPADIAHVEQAATLVRALDLRHGGEQAGQMAYQLLRWAGRMREAPMSAGEQHRLQAAIGVLAAWAGWAVFDTGRHTAARALFRLALEAAVQADEPDLRAHVLVDIAAQQSQLGHPADALKVVRLADGDERVCPAVQCMVHGVRARAYATLGDRDRCIREIGRAEDAAALVEPRTVPAWLGGWEPAHVEAVCGHAYAQLAHTRGGFTDLAEAHKRLEAAANDLAAAGRWRAAALCLVRLAGAHQRGGNPDEAAAWTGQAQRAAAGLGSARVGRALAAVCAASNGGGNGGSLPE